MGNLKYNCAMGNLKYNCAIGNTRHKKIPYTILFGVGY
jgi:hypothetical protein